MNSLKSPFRTILPAYTQRVYTPICNLHTSVVNALISVGSILYRQGFFDFMNKTSISFEVRLRIRVQ